jgi:hypothetical protein
MKLTKSYNEEFRKTFQITKPKKDNLSFQRLTWQKEAERILFLKVYHFN